MSADTPEQRRREQIEADYTFARTAQLHASPLPGKYDAAHLKAFNHHIFQDLPRLGFTDVTPGEFRPAVGAGQDWIKIRSLEGLNATSTAAYSRMDSAAIKQLDAVLKDADPAKLATLNKAQFTAKLADIYTRLDYIHPFSDGNSRTLRAFTEQLAKESGYDLDWSRFNRDKNGRNVLYIARDLSVNKFAMPTIQHVGTQRDVQLMLDQFEGNRDLPDLLRDAVRPARAVAFEKLTEAEALQKHPELGEAYKVLHAARAHFQIDTTTDARSKAAFAVVVDHVKSRLEDGHTTDFRPKTSQPHRSQGERRAARTKSNEDRSNAPSLPSKGKDIER